MSDDENPAGPASRPVRLWRRAAGSRRTRRFLLPAALLLAGRALWQADPPTPLSPFAVRTVPDVRVPGSFSLSFPHEENAIGTPLLSPDGRTLMWTVHLKQCSHRLRALLPHTAGDTLLCFYDVPARRLRRRLFLHDTYLASPWCSPDSCLLLAQRMDPHYASDMQARAWFLRDGREAWSVADDTDEDNWQEFLSYLPDSRLAASRDGKVALAVSSGTPILFDVSDPKDPWTIRQPAAPRQASSGPEIVGRAALSPDGKRYVLAGAAAYRAHWELSLHETRSGRRIAHAHGSEGGTFDPVWFAGEGGAVAFGARVWEPDSGRTRRLPIPDLLWCIGPWDRYSRRGLFVTGVHADTVELWDVLDGKRICAWSGFGEIRRAVGFSPESRTLITQDPEGGIHLRRLDVQ